MSMMWSERIDPKMNHLILPSSIRPGRKLPVMVVYLRRVIIQRCSGTMSRMTSSVMLANTVAPP